MSIALNNIEYSPPVQLYLKRKWSEYDDIYTFQFESERKLPFLAGQNARVVIPDLSEEEGKRSLSFASPPSDELIQFSMHTKSGSDFKQAMQNLSEGDRVCVVKIKGQTTLPDNSDIPIVCIAGGVGVTPFRSILFHLHQQQLPTKAVLVHVSRDAYLYQNELARLPYEQHRIRRNDVDSCLDEVVKTFSKAQYYIAGSPLFLEGFVKKLHELGLSDDRVLRSEFSGYDEELD